MKTLYIMRHPEKDVNSSPDDFFLTLTSKGESDAKSIAHKLSKRGVHPDLIVSSPSLRTETTSMILARELHLNKNILYNEAFYEGYLGEAIDEITFTLYTINTLIIVGHNPLLTNFANHFVAFKHRIDLGEVLQIEFDVSSWVDIDPSNAKLIELIKP
ncbi:MAG: histidine phosphatase family protein [Campylobacteraceae bacterium]|nr:histidine phosphatase family protein [Campylobacteraceae bacterium]